MFVLMTGKDAADQLATSPRLIKTHLPVQFVPRSFWEQNCRVTVTSTNSSQLTTLHLDSQHITCCLLSSQIVYVARNAKDNAVSYFHFDRMNHIQPEPGDWNTFLHSFMTGKGEFKLVLLRVEGNGLLSILCVLSPIII